jgi:uncharacterized membrane protein YgdD (TMEM256/DUF423 family)
MNRNQQLGFACLWLGLGIALGALGAHALKKVVGPAALAVFETGVRYHCLAALGMLFLAGAHLPEEAARQRAFGWLLLGSVLFSGSLYGLTFNPMQTPNAAWVKVLGPITPLGGALQIGTWCWLAWKFLRSRS